VATVVQPLPALLIEVGILEKRPTIDKIVSQDPSLDLSRAESSKFAAELPRLLSAVYRVFN
jgi:hypothetical protein